MCSSVANGVVLQIVNIADCFRGENVYMRKLSVFWLNAHRFQKCPSMCYSRARALAILFPSIFLLWLSPLHYWFYICSFFIITKYTICYSFHLHIHFAAAIPDIITRQLICSARIYTDHFTIHIDVNTSILFVSSTSALFLLLFCSVMFFAKMESDFFPFFVKLLLLSLVYGFSIVLEMYTCGREASVGVLVRNPLFVSSRIYS